MATTSPILFALRDLGTSVRTIFQDEASRRQAALVGQAQENEQRRALESLRLTGEQQLAKLGIEEAKTRFEIGKGQEQLGLERQRVGIEQQRATTATQEAQSLAQHRQETLGIAKSQEQRATELQPHLIATEKSRQSAARASEQAAGMQRQVESIRLQKEQLALQIAQGEMKPTTLGAYLGLAGDQALKATGGEALPRLSFMDSFVRGLGLDPTLPLANAHEGQRLVQILKEILPQNTAAIAQLGAQQQLAALPAGSPERQQFQQQYDAIYTPPRDRNAQANTYIKGVEQGVFPRTFTFDDYERVYGGRQQESNYEAHELFFKTFQENLPQAEKEKFAKASATEKEKLLKEWNERVRIFRQANGVVGTSALWLQQAREGAERKATKAPAPSTSAPSPAPGALSGVALPATSIPGLVQSSMQPLQVLQSALSKRFVGGKIPDGPHVVTLPGVDPGTSERIAVRVTNGRVVDFLAVPPPKPALGNAPSTPTVPASSMPEEEQREQYRQEFDRVFSERSFTGFNPYSMYFGRYITLRERGQTPEDARKSIEAITR